MSNSSLNIDNKIQIITLIILLILLFLITIVTPLLFINYLEFSGLGNFFINNKNYAIISVLLILYFIIIGEYYFNIKIDPYIIQIISYKPLSSLFREKDYIDIPHNMLEDYAFFKRPLSFNKTLMLKIKTDSGKIIIKRFNLTLISKYKIDVIRRKLNKILNKKT